MGNWPLLFLRSLFGGCFFAPLFWGPIYLVALFWGCFLYPKKGPHDQLPILSSGPMWNITISFPPPYNANGYSQHLGFDFSRVYGGIEARWQNTLQKIEAFAGHVWHYTTTVNLYPNRSNGNNITILYPYNNFYFILTLNRLLTHIHNPADINYWNSKVTWTDFEHPTTNFRTVLFKHSDTFSCVSATRFGPHPSAELLERQYTGEVQH